MATLRKNYWTFSNGVITEATALTFPEATTKDERNFHLNRDGSRFKRKGHASIQTWHDTTYAVDDDHAVQQYIWEFPDNRDDKALLVIQTGPRLYFYDAVGYYPEGFADLAVGANANFLGYRALDFATTNGVLVCTGPTMNRPCYITANFSGNPTTYAVKPYDILVRDVWGVDDTYETDYRPTISTQPSGDGLTPQHQYNIFNQGWGTAPPDLTGPAKATHTNFAEKNTDANQPANRGDDWPSNADIVSLGKEVKADGFGSFVPQLIRKSFLGNTPAPRGKCIMNLFDRGASRKVFNDKIANEAIAKGDDNTRTGYEYTNDIVVGDGGLPPDTESGRFRCVAFYAGRIFYGGLEGKNVDGDDFSPLMHGAVAYSQLLEHTHNLGRCYQEADPTSEEISDLIATDGGIIFIPDAANIVDMIPIGNALIIFSQTGIWSIQGSEAGFAADDLQTKKISEIGVLDRDSIIDMEGNVVFWAQNGIYLLAVEAGLGSYTIESLSRDKIQTLYKALTVEAKLYAKGYYDSQEQTLHWMFDSDAGNGTIETNEYRYELRYDLVLGSWYLYEWAKDTTASYPYIAGYANSSFTTQLSLGIVDTPTYLIMEKNASTYKFNFSRLTSDAFTDFGIGYPAWLRPGTELLLNGIDFKQDVIFRFFLRRTESVWDDNEILQIQSGGHFSVYWDFADDYSAVLPSDKVHGPTEVYKFQRFTLTDLVEPGKPFEYGRSVIVTKHKLRGRGVAVDLLITAEEGKDFQLLGWSAEYQTDGPDGA